MGNKRKNQSKKDQILTEVKKLNKKIDIVEESVNLGTLDATMLTLMIFIVALGFTLLSLNFTKSIQNIPQLLVFGVYFVVLTIPLIMAIYGYALSILQKEARFWRKRWVFITFEGLGIFMGFLFVTSNTEEKEFSEVKDSLQKQINKSKTKEKIQRARICCMDKSELISLAEFFKQNQDRIFKNKQKFLRIMRKGFNISGGYFKFSYVEDELKDLIKVINVYPTQKELRI